MAKKDSAWVCVFLLVMSLLAAVAQARVRPDAAPASIAAASRALQQDALRLGLDGASDFQLLLSELDTLGFSHVRHQQRFNGVPIWGAELVSHTGPDGRPRPRTNDIMPIGRVDTVPRLTSAMALAVAERELMRKGEYSDAPRIALVIFPLRLRSAPRSDRSASSARIDATMAQTTISGYRLAYHVLVGTRNARDGLREMRYFIDAHTGAILDQETALQRAHAVGSGARSIFNGLVAVNTNSAAGAYELRDLQRGSGGRFGNNVVLRYRAAGDATIFTDPSNTWGDGNSYIPDSPVFGSDDTAQSAGADVAYAVAVAWDMYRRVLGRAGYDAIGTSVHATVHTYYGWPYNTGANASWSTLCQCMDFGFGDSAIGLKNIVDLDIVGHELAHGLIQSATRLAYKGEPGGLNEGIADIFGLATKFYARSGGHGQAAPGVTPAGPWSIGEALGGEGFKRFFVRPSLESGSFDAWDSNFIDRAAQLDVHYLSGPVRRAFYFMSSGAAASGEGASAFLPGGMPGIGIQPTLLIWYRALSYYMTPLTDFTAARQALISAARDLYGAESDAEQAAWNAFAAINVGAPWAAQGCGRIEASRSLVAGQFVAACNGQYALRMEADGNLVLASTAGALAWQSATAGNPGAYYVKQTDGNLVLYRAGGISPLWHADSWGNPGASVSVGNDGNLIVIAPNGVPVWYLKSWPGAATTVASSQTNLSPASADVIAPTVTGITGQASWTYETGLEQPAYFRFVVPEGKTIRWDFVGGALVSSRWQLDALGLGGVALASGVAPASGVENTWRQLLSYANRSGAPAQVLLRIGRRNFLYIPDTMRQKYSVGVRYDD